MSLRPNVVASTIQPYSCAIFVSGALHWLACISKGGGKFLNQNTILSFDVTNYKFGQVELPDGIDQEWQHLVVMKGNLSFITLVHLETALWYGICYAPFGWWGSMVYLNHKINFFQYSWKMWKASLVAPGMENYFSSPNPIVFVFVVDYGG